MSSSAFGLNCTLTPSPTASSTQKMLDLVLRERFGFPDPECPVESPLSEYDVSTRMPVATTAGGQGA